MYAYIRCTRLTNHAAYHALANNHCMMKLSICYKCIVHMCSTHVHMLSMNNNNGMERMYCSIIILCICTLKALVSIKKRSMVHAGILLHWLIG